MRPQKPLILLLALLALPLAVSPASSAPPARAAVRGAGLIQDADSARAPAQLPPELRELLERSQRASFNAHSAELALAALAGGLEANLRPGALFALGASSERGMGPRLESWVVEGAPADRQAALLGLAEGGLAPVDLLARLARSGVAEVREGALLSLARLPDENAQTVFAKQCEPGAADPATAQLARLFATDPLAAPNFACGRVWLSLRWDAARRYGLVDGQPWRTRLLTGLAGDSTFLDALVYGAASELQRVGSADHFLEIALAQGSPERLRAVVNSIPSELDRMIQAGVWFPADQAEWAQLLYEIDDRRLEGLTVELLRQARAFPDLSAHAAVLLVRSGNFEGLSLLELDIASPDPEKRQRIAETLGGTRELRYVDLLESLSSDNDNRVRAAALIAQMRLGHVLSIEAVRNTLDGEPSVERTALVDGLARLAYLPEIARLLLEHVDSLSVDERLSAAIELARAGESRESAALHAGLSESLLRSSRGEHYVQALMRIGANAELQSLFEMFPLEDARAVNIQIAKAMCARRDPSILLILRSALWQAPFHRSALAGALILQVSGIDSLRIELERPPKGAWPVDVRRVGYCLGEWGGTAEVERLGSRRTAADPALQGALLGALAARTH